MPLKIFHIPSAHPADDERDLAAFLSSHRIVTVERHFVPCGLQSFWSICVDYLATPAGIGTEHGAPGRAARKIDYKEVLSPEQFEVFAKLRDLRKEFADREAVPVYAIFTNAQLAAMVETQVADRAGLGRIDGIGAARIEKYGDAFLTLMGQLAKDANETTAKTPAEA